MHDVEHCPSIRAIKELVADEFGFSTLLLVSDRRSAELAFARHVAIALCCDLTTFSLPAIGRQFGNRDHTTIVYARDRIADKCKDDSGFRIHYQSLVMRCREVIAHHEHIENVAAICTGSVEEIGRQLDSRLRIIRHRLLTAARTDPEKLLRQLDALSKHASFTEPESAEQNQPEKETTR